MPAGAKNSSVNLRHLFRRKALCSGLLTPGTHFGENARDREVSMIKQRRTFAPEFKREAACLVLGQGYSHPEAARSLGLVELALLN